jgi:signal peptidase I
MKRFFTKEYFNKSFLPFVYLVVALFALRWTFIEPYVVPTGSMEPTLKTGDRLYALKCAYDVRLPFTDYILFRTGKVKRGDVILFQAPRDPNITYVKRALGLPGDRLLFKEGRVFINDQEVMKEAHSNEAVMKDIDHNGDKTLFIEKLGEVKHYVILNNVMPHLRNTGEIIVPEDHVFAVGDNRDNSHDSRAWGFVPYSYLKGRAMFIWFSSWDFSPEFADRPSREFSILDTLMFWNWTVRPERIGMKIQ